MGESVNFADIIRKKFMLDNVDIKTYSPLTLSFIGDCIYDLIIRTILVEHGNRNVNGLHKDKSNLVKAQKQAEMADFLHEFFSDEEKEVYKRGKNSKTMSTAKNAKLSDYHKATGLECLFGYLYLQGKEDRILELVQMCSIS